MVRAARESLSHTAAEIQQGDIEEFDAAPGSFDLVLSQMALHYVESIADVFAGVHHWLSPGGRLVFTVVHPVVTSNDARASTREPRQDWVVDDYFRRGPRDQEWLGGKSRWYHRTIEDYVRLMRGAGFGLVNLRECEPVRERFDDQAEFERRRRIPLMLLLAGARLP